MQKLVADKAESLFCIRPKDKAVRDEFWNFKCAQASNTLRYFVIVQVLYLLPEFTIEFPQNLTEFK